MQIKIQPEQVGINGQQIQTKANEFQDLTQQISTKVHQLTSVWQGKDNLAFVSSLEQYQPQLKQLYTIMDAYGRFLVTSAARYQALQDERVQAAGRLL